MPTSDFPDIIHAADNALCAFWPIDTAVIAFDVLESLLHRLSSALWGPDLIYEDPQMRIFFRFYIASSFASEPVGGQSNT